MTIIKSTQNLTPKQLYDLTKNPSAGKLSTLAGTTLNVSEWALYESENAGGDIAEILAVIADGEIYRTNSACFIREFIDLTEMFPDATPLPVKVEEGQSKAGRTFIYAVYMGE